MISRSIHFILSKWNPYWWYAQKYYTLTRMHDVYEYNAPCDPYKITWVNPDSVQEITRRPRPLEYRVFGEVHHGNWDTRKDFQFNGNYKKKEYIKYKYPTMRFDDSVFYNSLCEHFIEGVSWNETEYVQNEIDRIKHGKIGWGNSETREELLSHCEFVDKLYKNIRKNGYKTQEELGHSNSFLEARRNEIMVDIGREGQLLYVDSRHRLAISKILDLDVVPVVFGVRHPEWMEIRDAVYGGDNSLSHPDLTSL